MLSIFQNMLSVSIFLLLLAPAAVAESHQSDDDCSFQIIRQSVLSEHLLSGGNCPVGEQLYEITAQITRMHSCTGNIDSVTAVYNECRVIPEPVRPVCWTGLLDCQGAPFSLGQWICNQDLTSQFSGRQPVKHGASFRSPSRDVAQAAVEAEIAQLSAELRCVM